jgi:O-antigen ligase
MSGKLVMGPKRDAAAVIAPGRAVPPRPQDVRPRAATADDAIQQNVFWKVGFFFVVLDLFFTYSRFPELATIWFGTNLAMARVVRMGGVAGALFSGGAFRAFSSPVGIGFALFSVWTVVCIPFSVWKGGSVALLRENWIPAMLAFTAVNGIIFSTKHVYRCIYVIAVSSFVIVAMSGTFGAVEQDRMAFELGTLSNSNDLATLVLLGIPPLILFFQLNPGRRRLLVKIAILATLPYMLSLVVKTASRGALLNLVLIAAITFLVSPLRGKVKILFLTFALMVVLVSFAPREALARYATMVPFFGSGMTDASSTSITEAAAASSAAREHLLRESIEMTFKHPIFGVGPGVFIAANATRAEKEGERPIWLASHNGFTQVSSECGIIGFLLYMTAFVACFKFTLAIRKRVKDNPELQHINHIAVCLLIALSCMVLNYCLGSIAYLPVFPILAAITDGFYRSATTEINKWHRTAAPARSSPVPPSRMRFARGF